MKQRSAGHLQVEAVEKPSREIYECHFNSSTAQSALCGPIASRGIVEGPSDFAQTNP